MNDTYTQELHRLKGKESGAIGGLKGTVAGFLIRQDVGLDLEPKDWKRLRDALYAAEEAQRAVIDHLCKPELLV